jgi:hypothetical protein
MRVFRHLVLPAKNGMPNQETTILVQDILRQQWGDFSRPIR